ncbi:MAG: nucleoside deaminase [Bilophila wadsworthia]
MQEKLFNRLMDVIEYDVAPLTRKRVAIGCKVFGAAVLRKDDLSLVLAETNMEAFSPLWHGEVYAIKQFWELQGHPDPKDCIFIATHQPCCMCASAIAWSGFPELFYLFGYEKRARTYPDQKMIRELFIASPAEDSTITQTPHHGPVRSERRPVSAHQEP